MDIKKAWVFKSDSNPNKTYQTLQYTDESTSCDCKGWTTKKKDKERSCKHTRLVNMGIIADDMCMSCVDYGVPKQSGNIQTKPTTQTQTVLLKPQRKIRW